MIINSSEATMRITEMHVDIRDKIKENFVREISFKDSLIMNNTNRLSVKN